MGAAVHGDGINYGGSKAKLALRKQRRKVAPFSVRSLCTQCRGVWCDGDCKPPDVGARKLGA